MPSKDLRIDFLNGRIQAQHKIMIALYGYIAVADTSAARGLITALKLLIENADSFTTGEIDKLGFQNELHTFIESTELPLSS